jgi:dolichol-phosphate mannosyltransferase
VAALSVVAPVYNEEAHLAEFIERCVRAASACAGDEFEIVLVDDGSVDRSREVIREAMRRHPGSVKLLELSRNFGQQAAFHAGLAYARGDVIVTLDSDLQDPPEVIPRLVEKLAEGFDVVYARRVSARGKPWGASGHRGLKAFGAFMFHQLMSRTQSNPIPADVGEFRCLRRSLLDRLLEFPESMIFIPGLVAYLGFDAGFSHYMRGTRGDRAPTTLRHLTARALDALTTFSVTPTIIVMILGLAAWAAPLTVLVWAGWELLLGPGLSVTTLTWLVGSAAWATVCFSLAVIAHYVGRIFIEVKRRPRYFIKRVVEKPDDR